MLTKKNYRLFNMAKNMAEMSTFYKAQIGCVLAYGNKVISSGFNCEKTHPLQNIYNAERFEGGEAKLHAETHAIIPLLKKEVDWKNVSLYVCRYGKKTNDGKSNIEMSMARPCKSCMKMIKDLGIRDIYYTTDDGYSYERIDD